MSKNRFQKKVNDWIHDYGDYRLSRKETYKRARLEVSHLLIDPYGKPDDALEAIEAWEKDKRYYGRVPFMGFDAFGFYITPNELKQAALFLQSQPHCR